MTASKQDAFHSLRYPEFRNYIISRFFFILVLNMQATLISWQVYDITKDPFSIGMIGLVEFAPAFCMAFYSGYVIDKSDKRNLLFRAIVGNFILTSLLCFFTTDLAAGIFSRTWLLLVIYFVVFCIGILRSFSGPSSFALVSHLVPREHLANATLWHSGSWQVGAVSGPALAGLLYGSIGITYTFYLMLLLMSIAVTGMYFIKPKPFTGTKREEKIIESIRQGFRFVWRSKEVLGAMSLDLFAVLFGGATALLPVFADQILHVGPEGLGMLRSAPALGSVVILMLLTFRPLKRAQGRIMLFCVAGFGLCIITFGLSDLFWLSLLALFISGILDGVSVIVRSTILQLKTPDEMRGRVASLNSIFIMSSNELGSFESGVAAKLLGTVPAVVFGGGMTLAVVVFTWFKAPGLRKLQY
ncbi:MAG TPA: MFS transporter [Chitinophagaceae bacterium]|nr:MFS transporter [Chitinophagaceae bacterium]